MKINVPRLNKMFLIHCKLVILPIITIGIFAGAVDLTQDFGRENRNGSELKAHKNANLLHVTPTYVGCFYAWNGRHAQLYSPQEQSPFNPLNGLFSCADKCVRDENSYHFLYIRGIECQCAKDIPEDEDTSHTNDSFCNYSCTDKFTVTGDSVEGNSCGGNVAYSVYRLYTETHGFSSVLPQIISEEQSAGSFIKLNMDYELVVKCGICQLPGNQCTPESISPYFDYFPLNNAQDCVDFCASNINYVYWNENGVKRTIVRNATDYAILTWRRFSDVDKNLPICLCGSDSVKTDFIEAEGYCKLECPGNKKDMCGGLEGSSIFGSVYCIENGSGQCPQVSTTTTTTTTTTTEKSSQTTLVPTKPYTTTTTEVSTTTKKLTTKGSTFSTTVSTTLSSSTTDNEQNATTGSTTNLIPSTTTSPLVGSCRNGKKCRRTDRLKNVWTACPGKTKKKECSVLISDSNGIAYWKCNKKGEFETLQPDVSQCKSKWVQEKESELEGVNDIEKAINLTSSLSRGCNKSEKKNEKYFGHEIANLATLMNETLYKARRFDTTPSESEFVTLVKEAVDLNACLISTHEPWNDLSLVNKSYLSTQLMETTEDVLFHLTEFIMPYYSIEFTPISQFKAVAQAFDKQKDNETHEFPPASDTDRESFIKLPVGWSCLLPENKVEIAVISIATESVAKVMTGTGKYEVNGQVNKIINGRMISLSVTSSSNDDPSSFKGEFHGVRSKSLNFPGKGVEITFPHSVDAWGDKAYEIRRTLHKGEKPKAALGSASCIFWDTKEFEWSSKGCHLMKTSRLETVCECSHLTSFAILMDVHRYIGKQLGLKILTLVLCPLSEVALLFTIVILSLTRNCMYKIRSRICKHLSFCLFLGNGMILVVLDREYFHMSDGVCMAAAMVTHYVFLCAFMWMLFEGVQLYRMVVHVFDSGKSYMRHYTTIAYVSPLIIIAVTSAIGHIKEESPYGGDAYCWLIGNYTWSFMMPIAVVITVNLIILFIALKTAYQLQHDRQRERKLSPIFILDEIRSYRIYFKGCFSLTVILGITWIIGFFTLMEGSSQLIAAYLFTILNASQGFFIFLFTCRTYLSKTDFFSGRKLSSYLPSIMNSSSSVRSSIDLKKPHIGSKGKFDVENESKY